MTTATKTNDATVKELTREEAEILIGMFNNSYAEQCELLLQMFEGKAHKAMGYENFNLFCEEVLELGHCTHIEYTDKHGYSHKQIRNPGVSNRLISARVSRICGEYVPSGLNHYLDHKLLSDDKKREIWQAVKPFVKTYGKGHEGIDLCRRLVDEALGREVRKPLGKKVTVRENQQASKDFPTRGPIVVDGVKITPTDIRRFVRSETPKPEPLEAVQEALPLPEPVPFTLEFVSAILVPEEAAFSVTIRCNGQEGSVLVPFASIQGKK